MVERGLDAGELLCRCREVLAAHPPLLTADRELREARFDAGLAFVQWTPAEGGSDADATLNALVEETFIDAGSTDWRDRNVIGLGMAAPTLHSHGTASQRQLLRPLFSGEHVWCQLFSEPGAGSDLAALSTTAVRDGDEWIINGQKLWTTLAHTAAYGLLLARTDSGATKHRGLTYYILDMKSAGVEVRPLRQITGEAEFNEVFLTDVRVPDRHRIGDVGQGWGVAMTTLANERSSLGVNIGERGSGPIGQAVDAYRAATTRGRVEPELRDRLVRLWARVEAGRMFDRQQAMHGASDAAGSLSKLRMAELNQGVYDLCMDLLGPEALLFDDFAETRPETAGVHGGGDPRRAFLRTLANSIEGGTSEVQRTIIGERVIGLPPEPRVDKDRPWSEVPRS